MLSNSIRQRSVMIFNDSQSVVAPERGLQPSWGTLGWGTLAPPVGEFLVPPLLLVALKLSVYPVPVHQLSLKQPFFLGICFNRSSTG